MAHFGAPRLYNSYTVMVHQIFSHYHICKKFIYKKEEEEIVSHNDDVVKIYNPCNTPNFFKKIIGK